MCIYLNFIFAVPAIPMKLTLQGFGRLSRAMSMEDADKPRKIVSVLDGSK